MKNIVLRGNDKLHMTSHLRWACGIPSDKTAYKTQRNLVVKLNKEAKKSFLKTQITENGTKKRNIFGNRANFFSLRKVFVMNRNLLLKLEEV